MALIKDRQTTEKNRSARQRNGRQSRGAATAAGKERSRAANLKHGYYSQIRDEALVALGEDPAALAALIAGAHEQWRPANPHQAWITERLARLQWKIDRSDRMQENAMARAVQRVADRRADTALKTRYRYADVHNPLSMISCDTLRPDYYTPPGYFVNFARALKVNPGPRMDEILRLLHRLREPEGYQPFTGRLRAGATTHREWKEAREVFADDSAIPHPEIPIAQGEERDDLCAELHDLAAAELEEVKLVWEDKLLPEADEPLTQQDRDDLAASTYKMTELIRRQEHSCFREFFRLGTLLVKLQTQDKSEVKQESEVRSPRSKEGSEVRGPMSAESSPGADTLTPDSCLLTSAPKNEGASGDVDENTGGHEPKKADFQHYAPPEVAAISSLGATAGVQQAGR
jgi:hypothetical protein